MFGEGKKQISNIQKLYFCVHFPSIQNFKTSIWPVMGTNHVPGFLTYNGFNLWMYANCVDLFAYDSFKPGAAIEIVSNSPLYLCARFYRIKTNWNK